MRQVTISVTAPQAVRLLEQLQGSGMVSFNVRGPRRKGEQHGGFLPILAALAGPALGAIASKGIDYLMGGSLGKAPCLTCTDRQYHTLKQLGSGAQIAINFKIRSPGTRPSIGTQQAHQTLAGAGIYSTIAGLLGRLGSSAYSALTSNAAKKIAAGAAAQAISKGSDYAQKYVKDRFDTPEEAAALDLNSFPPVPVGVPGMSAAAPRTVKRKSRGQRGEGMMLAGRGAKLAGHGLRLAGRPGQKKTSWSARCLLRAFTRNRGGDGKQDDHNT